MTLTEIGKQAKEASAFLMTLSSEAKEQGLRLAAKALMDGQEEILTASQKDVEAAEASGMNPGLVTGFL